MRVGVGQAHGGAPPGPRWTSAVARSGPPRRTGDGGVGQARGLEGRLAVEVVHGAAPVERGDLLDQGALLVLVEVGGDPGVEHDEGPVARDGGGDVGAGPSACRRARGAAGAPMPARWPGRRAGGRSAPGCRATGRPAASGPRRRRTGRRARGRARPARPWRAGGARAGASGRPAPCTRGRPPSRAAPAVTDGAPVGGPVGVGVVVEEQVEAGRGARGRAATAARAQPYCDATWQRPGSSAVQRPTSLVWVVRVATSCSSSARCSAAEVGEAGRDVTSGGGANGTPRTTATVS